MEGLFQQNPKDVAVKLEFQGYLLIVGFFTVIWSAFYFVTKWVLGRFNQTFQAMNKNTRQEYLSNFIGFFHSVISFLWAVYNVWYSCKDGQSWFESEECRTQPNNSVVWALMFSAGYFVVDFCAISATTENKTSLDYQMLVHHLTVVTTIMVALTWYDYLTTCSAAMLFIEISNPFVCARFIMFAHGMLGGHPIQTLNSIGIFLSFFFGRCLFQFYTVFHSLWMYLINFLFFSDQEVSIEQWLAKLFIFFSLCLNICMNFYWGYLILNQFIRVIKRGFASDKEFNSSQADEPKVEDGPPDKGVEMGAILDKNAPKSDLV